MDPHYPDGPEYLAGVSLLEDGRPEYRAFWAHDHEEERRSFERLMDFICGRLQCHPGAHVYHYGHHEEAALKRLASRYAVREGLLDNLLRPLMLIDLCKVVREGIRVSEPGYSLKHLERFCKEERPGEVKTAGQSIVVYERWPEQHDDGLLNGLCAQQFCP